MTVEKRFGWNDHAELRALCALVQNDDAALTLRLRNVVLGLLDLLRPALSDHRLIWEDIAIALCCGADGCDAANRGPENDMSPDRYCEQHGCQSKEIAEQAEQVLTMLRAKITVVSATATANVTERA